MFGFWLTSLVSRLLREKSRSSQVVPEKMPGESLEEVDFFTMPSSSIGTKGRLAKSRVGLLRVTAVDSPKPRTEGQSGSLSFVSVSPTERILETAKVSIRYVSRRRARPGGCSW